MPPTVTRLHEPRPAFSNQGTQKGDTITYLVRDQDVRQTKLLLLNGTGIPGIPVEGFEDHPDFPGLGMIARTYTRVQDVGTGRDAEVDVFFATSNLAGSGLLYAIPDRSGGQFTIEATFEDVNVPIPIAYRTQQVVGEGGGAVTLDYFEVKPKLVRETRIVLGATWQLGGGSFGPSDFAAFDEQHNRVHFYLNAKRLFRVQSIRARDNLTYTVSASWTLDRGTDAEGSWDPDLYKLPIDMRPVPGSPPFINGYMRNPFHYLETVAVSQDDFPNLGPRITQHREYVEDLNGWQSLPGVPQL